MEHCVCFALIFEHPSYANWCKVFSWSGPPQSKGQVNWGGKKNLTDTDHILEDKRQVNLFLQLGTVLTPPGKKKTKIHTY